MSHIPLIVCLTSHGSSSISVFVINKSWSKVSALFSVEKPRGSYGFFYFLIIFSQLFHWITDFNKFPEKIIWSNDIYSWIDLGYNLAQTYLQTALYGTRRCCHCLSSFKQNLEKNTVLSLKICCYEVKITDSPSRARNMRKRIFLRQPSWLRHFWNIILQRFNNPWINLPKLQYEPDRRYKMLCYLRVFIKRFPEVFEPKPGD